MHVLFSFTFLPRHSQHMACRAVMGTYAVPYHSLKTGGSEILVSQSCVCSWFLPSSRNFNEPGKFRKHYCFYKVTRKISCCFILKCYFSRHSLDSIYLLIEMLHGKRASVTIAIVVSLFWFLLLLEHNVRGKHVLSNHAGIAFYNGCRTFYYLVCSHI